MLPFFTFSMLYTIILSFLGKIQLIDGLLSTITFRGEGMQLYFLPYLLLVTITHAYIDTYFLKQRLQFISILIILLIIISFIFKSPSPTGSDLNNIQYYWCAYTIGVFIKINNKFIYLITLIMILSAFGLFDNRFITMSGIVIIFLFTLWISRFLPNKRLPGSGGVYLLHTPIVNFIVSTLLYRISVYNVANIILSVIITYLLCILISLIIKNKFPSVKDVILE